MGQNSGLLSSLTDWNSTLAGYADSISSGVVMPIALTVLALFMVLELYNFTQTIAMNGGSTAFTIQQVALVMLKITLCRWAVLHSTEILNAKLYKGRKQTVKRAADNKRRYAPGEGSIPPVLLSGVSKGVPPLAHDFACKV